MKRALAIIVLGLIAAVWCSEAAADDGAIRILRQGLLGAGTGAAATAVSGAKGDAIWQGALVGMGVNVVGGALLDVLTTPDGNRTVAYVRQAQPVTYRVVQVSPVPQPRPRTSTYRRVYRAGFRDGYRQGYSDGYNDALYTY